ncbi:MAG: MFS transporter, partial [Gordonibacter sp.]
MKKRAWIPVWAVIVASILISFEYGKVPPSQPSMIELLGLSFTMQGLLMTAFSVAAIVMGLVGGSLIDRFGARKIVSIALVVSVVGNVMGLLWTSDAGLLASRVMEGFGYGAVMTGGPVIISAWYAPAKRGLAYGVWGANVGVGMLICTGAANPILAATDWSGMWVFSLVAAVLALVMVALCVGMPADAERQDLFLDDGSKVESDAKHGVLWGYLAPLPILAALMFFLLGGATDAFNAFTITYLNVGLGYDYGAANLCSFIASIGLLVGAVIMGFVFAKAKDKGLVLIVNIVLGAIGL